ncbi:MAG TPA: succinate dehydrogenase cytochrome b subunit [Mycobacteriales bacterium]|nr:succinate dehydrogenase cytochrome b subunit [Mycobacteriales bacterium]
MTTVALTAYRSTIGRKAVMALSGLMLFGFVVVHMIGNLKIFTGDVHFDEYAEGLRGFGKPFFGSGQFLWVSRVVLLAAVLAHIASAVSLTRTSRAARPVRYVVHKPTTSSYASRTMRWGGVIIALFIVYHVLHFTTGQAHQDFRHGEVYHNVVSGFEIWYVSAFYILANVALGLHLFHGLWSMFQTLGWGSGRFSKGVRGFSVLAAAAITFGNISIPVAVLTGVLD